MIAVKSLLIEDDYSFIRWDCGYPSGFSKTNCKIEESKQTKYFLLVQFIGPQPIANYI